MITRINPDTLHRNPAFSQVAVIDPGATIVYVGGQNPVDANGQIIGEDIATQTEQTMNNVIKALESAGATLRDVFKMTIYLVQGQSLQEGFRAASQFSEMAHNPPTISVIIVKGLANPAFLVEIEAVAAINVGDKA